MNNEHEHRKNKLEKDKTKARLEFTLSQCNYHEDKQRKDGVSRPGVAEEW